MGLESLDSVGETLKNSLIEVVEELGDDYTFVSNESNSNVSQWSGLKTYCILKNKKDHILRASFTPRVGRLIIVFRDTNIQEVVKRIVGKEINGYKVAYVEWKLEYEEPS